MSTTRPIQDSTRGAQRFLAKGRTLADTLRGQDNNFGIVRLVAAVLVMFGHSFILQPAMGRTDPLHTLTGNDYSGSLAVYAFFFLSGILISQSWDRQNTLGAYVALRIGRIWPALIVCVVLITLVAGPLLSTQSVSAYMQDKMTFGFLIRNITLFSGLRTRLPGLFEDNVFHGVNSSLWTLPVEVMCYVMVAVLGISTLARGKVRVLIGAGLAVLVWLALFHVHTHLPVIGTIVKDLTEKPGDFSAHPVPFFIAGFVAYHYRKKIVLRGDFAIALCVGYVLSRDQPWANALLYVTFIYGLMVFSGLPQFKRLRPDWDISYGLYIYGFFVQQVVASYFPQQDNLLGVLISLAITTVVAAGSWFLVEKPAIAFVRRMLGKKQATPHPDPATASNASDVASAAEVRKTSR
ncbi:acyltransferase family protein [Robbsia andropogonis]|nr:acyltransferase [Robbsia andropogonis]MCP1117424.1 acyltransferase [Robbsia andropogonis]MCP1126890.1 acyltransferase [Robbsia andropogonis]